MIGARSFATRSLVWSYLLLLFFCSRYEVRAEELQSVDTLSTLSPQPLEILPAVLWAAYPMTMIDKPLRDTRHVAVGTTFRCRYDDVLQYAPFAMQLSMHFAGVSGRSRSTIQMLTADGIAALGTVSIVELMKYGIGRLRPDATSFNSFPSGHTATAFLGSELFYIEFGEQYPLLARTQYLFAAAVAAGRILNNRHWASDTFWGAIAGMTMARLGYLASDLIYGRYCHRVWEYEALPDHYWYVSPFTAYSMRGMQIGGQIGYQSIGYHVAGEWTLSPSATRPSIGLSLIGGTRFYQDDRVDMRQSYGVGVTKMRGQAIGPSWSGGIDCSLKSRYTQGLRFFVRLEGNLSRPLYWSLGLSRVFAL